jgi:hypothetical protein
MDPLQTCLDLSSRRLSKHDARFVAEVLANTSLSQLSLAKNDLGADGGYSLATALASNTSLTKLDASWNGLGPIGEG